MLSPDELTELCDLSENEAKRLDTLKNMTKKYLTSPNKQPELKFKILEDIQNLVFYSIIRFALLDKNIESMCHDAELNHHWNDYFQKHSFKKYCMKPRNDLPLFSQTQTLFCFLESINDHYHPSTNENWHQLAIAHDSWHACLIENTKDETALFYPEEPYKSWNQAAPLIQSMLNRSFKMALTHWTPGFLMLANTYKQIGCFFLKFPSDSEYLKSTINDFFDCSYEAFLFATALASNSISEIATLNAAYGDLNNLGINFGFETFDKAKEHLRNYCLDREPLKIKQRAIQNAGLFASAISEHATEKELTQFIPVLKLSTT